jgi:hypothetical protein
MASRAFGRRRKSFGSHAAISDRGYNHILRPNFFSSSRSEIWIIVGRPCGQQ